MINSIILEYEEVIEQQKYEKVKHVKKEYDLIPLHIVKAIETLLDNYKRKE